MSIHRSAPATCRARPGDRCGKSLPSDQDGAFDAALSQLDWLADRYAAVDSVFASEGFNVSHVTRTSPLSIGGQ